jgi:uncharacterized protein with HEPN domain
MPLSENDSAYLWDIDDACNDIIQFIENTSYRDFENNKMKRFAVERQLLVIGEAANHLSDECRNSNPDIPWKLMIGLRNIIAHDYGEVLVNRIYKIATENVIDLKNDIRKMINS